MSIQAIVWAMNTRVGDPTLKVLLIALANYANTENQTWHRQETISHDTEIPVRTLRRRMHQLVEMGLITVEERRRDDGTKTTSLVTVNVDQSIKRPLVADGASGQKRGSPAANKVAGQEPKDNHHYSEAKASGAEAPIVDLFPRADSPPPTSIPEVQKAPDARVYARGREVLGKQAGGLIRKLIDAREKNYALCVADIETASTKAVPAQWIGKIIANRTEDRYADLDPRAFGGRVIG